MKSKSINISQLLEIRDKINSMILSVRGEDYMTNKEVCDLLNISPTSLYNLTRVYNLKDNTIRSHLCYKRSEVEKLKLAKDLKNVKV